MKKLRVGQVRELIGIKVVLLHKWGEEAFAIAPLSRKFERPDQWKTANGLVVHCGLVDSENNRWLIDNSRLIGAIGPADLDACWYVFCDQLEGAYHIPTRIKEDQIRRRMIKEWPEETPQALAKAKKEWLNFMAVCEPLED